VKLIYGDNGSPSQAKYSPVNLIQEKDSIGQSFYFAVNGKPTFMKGANWIPADVFLPRISKQRYRDLLLAAKEANFNMLRVWGGGIYEDDYFYSLCDSLGIYVWQDFMFAGAMYPADEHFIENIKQEAIDNILRLRKFKCIVLWCGNNEIDEAWHNWGWQKQFHISEKDSTTLWTEYKRIFDDLLPSLLKQYDPGRPYISSSPLYGWGRQQSMTHGDSHYWGMWWGMDDINIMKHKIPRFMSEYGMQAMPSLKTIQQFALPTDMDTSSVIIKLHQKHSTGFQTLTNYLAMEKIKCNSFQSFITATQELQSRALTTAIQAQLHSNGRCMGSLLWQFNDCWPVCSWSIVDYYGCKKKAYYTVQKLYR
jgi:beta-mannosidase